MDQLISEVLSKCKHTIDSQWVCIVEAIGIYAKCDAKEAAEMWHKHKSKNRKLAELTRDELGFEYLPAMGIPGILAKILPEIWSERLNQAQGDNRQESIKAAKDLLLVAKSEPLNDAPVESKNVVKQKHVGMFIVAEQNGQRFVHLGTIAKACGYKRKQKNIRGLQYPETTNLRAKMKSRGFPKSACQLLTTDHGSKWFCKYEIAVKVLTLLALDETVVKELESCK